jgi:hypothetical protein
VINIRELFARNNLKKLLVVSIPLILLIQVTLFYYSNQIFSQSIVNETDNSYIQKITGTSISYPAEWYSQEIDDPDRVRYPEIPTVVLSSSKDLLSINPYASKDVGIPVTETVIFFSFDGSDVSGNMEFSEYMGARAKVIHGEKTQEIKLGDKQFLAFEDFGGAVFIYNESNNGYYSFFIPNISIDKLDQEMAEVLTSIRTSDQFKGYLPEKDKSKVLISESHLNSVLYNEDSQEMMLLTVPSMKLPWDSGYKNFNSGPHGGTSGDTSCTTELVLDDMSGVDYGMSTGTEVLSVANGTKVAQGYVTPGGYFVKVDHGSDFYSLYYHLMNFETYPPVPNDAVVTQGTVLAKSGSDGHLHLEFNDNSGDISAHGISIDGYTIRAKLNNSNGKGWNYQGSMTVGSESEVSASENCNGTPTSYKHWEGSTSTIYPNAGGGAAVLSTNSKNYYCYPPASGNWVVTTDCYFTTTATVPADLTVQNNALFTIVDGAVLNMDLANYKLQVTNGSGMLIKNGGKLD